MWSPALSKVPNWRQTAPCESEYCLCGLQCVCRTATASASPQLRPGSASRTDEAPPSHCHKSLPHAAKSPDHHGQGAWLPYAARSDWKAFPATRAATAPGLPVLRAKPPTGHPAQCSPEPPRHRLKPQTLSPSDQLSTAEIVPASEMPDRSPATPPLPSSCPPAPSQTAPRRRRTSA